MFPPKADAQENIIKICNDGNTLMWVARVRNEVGWNIRLGGADNYPHRVYGWYSVSPGSCAEVWHSDVIWSNQMWFSIVYKDRWGTAGAYYFEPRERGLFEAASAFSKDDARFCIPDANPATFSMTSDSARSAGEWCDPKETGLTGLNFNFKDRPTASGFWQLFPFLLKWNSGRVGNAFGTRTYTFTVSPDSNEKVWWPLKKYADYKKTSISVDVPFPEGVPAPSDGTNSIEPILAAVAKLAEAAKKGERDRSKPEPLFEAMNRVNGTVRFVDQLPTLEGCKCEYIGTASPKSIVGKDRKAPAGYWLLSVEMTLAESVPMETAVGVKTDDLAVETGGRAYSWQYLQLSSQPGGPPQQHRSVKLIFAVPVGSSEFQLSVGGRKRSPISLK